MLDLSKEIELQAVADKKKKKKTTAAAAKEGESKKTVQLCSHH